MWRWAVEPMSGPSAAIALSQVLWDEVRHAVAVLCWLLVIGLAGAAGCWCCGYAARSAWLRAGPPMRRSRRGAARDVDLTADPPDVDPELAEEVARGIREIELYLARVGSPEPAAGEPAQN